MYTQLFCTVVTAVVMEDVEIQTANETEGVGWGRERERYGGEVCPYGLG